MPWLAKARFKHELSYTERGCMRDILDRLLRDPGSLTYGELVGDRVWGVQEIRRLRSDVESMKTEWAARATHKPAAVNPPDFVSQLNPNRLVRLKELRQITGLSRSTIYKMVSEGRFPRPVKLNERASAWRMADVLKWQEGLGE